MQVIKGRQYFKVRSFTTLREMLDQSATLFGDRVAFRFRLQPDESPRTKTYAAFRAEINALGQSLCQIGLQGMKYAVVGDNSYAWCLAFTTIVCGAGTAVPLDRLLPPEEMIGLLQRSASEVIFYDASFHTLLQQNLADLPSLKVLICLQPDRLSEDEQRQCTWSDPKSAAWSQRTVNLSLTEADHEGDSVEGEPAGVPARIRLRLADLLAAGADSLQQEQRDYQTIPLDPDALMSLLFTSGTTSLSKAVMLSHNNVCADIRGIAGMVRLKPGIRMLSVLPLHHTFENTCGLFMALYVGAEIHETDGLRYIQKNMQEYGIDMIIGVPLLFASFYAKIQATLVKTGKDRLIRKMIPLTQGLRRVGIDVRRLAYRRILEAFGGRLHLGICGAAPIDPDIIRFFDAIGVRILQGYGLTETSPVACGCHSKLFVPGTVGRPVAGVEVAIDAEQPGADGEILVRGPIVMLGYYGDPALTAEVIDADGWFHTGDLGRLDPRNRCISITGRVKSMIVLKNGKKVFPEELEYLIGQAGWIKESLVWGDTRQDGDVIVSAKLVIDRDRLGETIGTQVDESAIRQALEQLIGDINARLPSFKGIRQYVYSFQELVKTTTLKVRRPVEIDRISELMQRQKLRWQELTGQNIDQVVPQEQKNAEHDS